MTDITPNPNPIEVFFAYSREDEELLKKLIKHLRPLQRDGVISTWYDRDISAGSEWEGEIDRHLHSAKIILLLISADFMDSDYCYGVEMNKAMKRHEAKEVAVIPVILRPVDWRIAKFSKLQALPKNAEAVTIWNNQDEAFLDIAQGIRKVAKKLNNSVPVKPIPPLPPIPKPVDFTRRRLLKGAGLAGAGLGASLLGKLAWDYFFYDLKKSDPFPVITVNSQGKEINCVTKTAKYFTEDLGNGITLDMVYIPNGTFWMGTEDEEIERLVQKYDWDGFRREQPRHEVTVQPFYMGKFQVTQEQWKEVASWNKIDRTLETNPSYVKKGNKYPVEKVSWYDAVEFCKRLSKKTWREYRLPSEAQWEYACRAGTTTPFHFGETITTDLANYNGRYTYGDGKKGTYRNDATSVGSFPPNGFGLYDMHGNVWELFADPWHKNYQDAPDDDRVWEAKGNASIHALRGGCWGNDPYVCRSAYRYLNGFGRDDLTGHIGFRVVCVAPRTS